LVDAVQIFHWLTIVPIVNGWIEGKIYPEARFGQSKKGFL
jgi:hypothetical protein